MNAYTATTVILFAIGATLNLKQLMDNHFPLTRPALSRGVVVAAFIINAAIVAWGLFQ